MALVVLLRGVNLGAKRFRPAGLARQLEGLDVRSVGAAGTFVVRAPAAERAVRRAFAEALPFEADVIAVPAAEVLDLLARKPGAPRGAKVFVSVLAAAPGALPTLPIDRPEGRGWQIRLLRVEGRFAVSARRNTQGRFYPNELVEKELGVRATTRGWDTLLAVREALGPGAQGA